jgi:REP element-mobilizing transposase RayT
MNHHDYTLNGMYFITICVQNHRCVFGRIENGKMIANSFGQIAHERWCELSKRFPNVKLDAFIVMPNHMHGILVLDNSELPISQSSTVGATLAVAHARAGVNTRAGVKPAPTGIPKIIGMYKSLVLHHTLQYFKTNCPDMILGKLWQRGYYDHVIRNYIEYETITNYIANNPLQWNNDKLFHP